VAVVLSVTGGVGCSGDDAAGREAMRAGFAAVAAAVDVDDLDGPNETTSKDVTYLTGSGLVEGDPDAAVDRAVSGLRAAGWEVSEVRPGGGGDGLRVVASSRDVTTQIAVRSVAGLTEAPEGSSIIQIAVASSDAGLAWTN
jgi:hypothetical protein